MECRSIWVRLLILRLNVFRLLCQFKRSFGSSCFPDAILWHIEANVDPAIGRNIYRSPFVLTISPSSLSMYFRLNSRIVRPPLSVCSASTTPSSPIPPGSIGGSSCQPSDAACRTCQHINTNIDPGNFDSFSFGVRSTAAAPAKPSSATSVRWLSSLDLTIRATGDAALSVPSDAVVVFAEE